MGFLATRTSPQWLLPLERVFDAADSILDLSCRLIGLAYRLQFGITKHLAGNLLGFAFDLLRRFDAPVLSMIFSPRPSKAP
jgi:hypothetical protein